MNIVFRFHICKIAIALSVLCGFIVNASLSEDMNFNTTIPAPRQDISFAVGSDTVEAVYTDSPTGDPNWIRVFAMDPQTNFIIGNPIQNPMVTITARRGDIVMVTMSGSASGNARTFIAPISTHVGSVRLIEMTTSDIGSDEALENYSVPLPPGVPSGTGVPRGLDAPNEWRSYHLISIWEVLLSGSISFRQRVYTREEHSPGGGSGCFVDRGGATPILPTLYLAPDRLAIARIIGTSTTPDPTGSGAIIVQ